MKKRFFPALRSAPHRRRWRLWILCVAFAAVSGRLSPAQANQYTADKRLGLSVFGMASYVKPDYDGAVRNGGGAVGVDADIRQYFRLLRPGLEVRVTGSGGTETNQYTYGGGPRVVIGNWRVKPYADFLVSYGEIKFNRSTDPTYQEDHSSVYTYGGGVEVDLSRSWALQGDVQSERWRLTYRAPPFHPLAMSVGVRYTLHFHDKYSPE